MGFSKHCAALAALVCAFASTTACGFSVGGFYTTPSDVRHSVKVCGSGAESVEALRDWGASHDRQLVNWLAETPVGLQQPERVGHLAEVAQRLWSENPPRELTGCYAEYVITRTVAPYYRDPRPEWTSVFDVWYVGQRQQIETICVGATVVSDPLNSYPNDEFWNERNGAVSSPPAGHAGQYRGIARSVPVCVTREGVINVRVPDPNL